MKKFGYLILFSFLRLNTTFAQSSTKLIYDLGFGKYDFQFYNYQNNVTTDPHWDTNPAFLINQQVYKNLFLESGLVINTYDINCISENPIDTTNFWYINTEFQIPLRVQIQHSFLKNRLEIFTSVGTLFCFNMNHYPMYRLSTAGILDNLDIQYTNEYYSKQHFLMEFGAGANTFITKNFFIGCRFRYSFSSKEQLNFEARRINTNNDITDYVLKSNGNQKSFTISIGYQISKFWNKSQK
ncbi:MAG: hypothetical protein LBS52_09045 [Dysgonamonadaceae bacterium]|jgi:hypothetical protein|nr:hypothetical protein [Dysgonamonadaceae bacterium]